MNTLLSILITNILFFGATTTVKGFIPLSKNVNSHRTGNIERLNIISTSGRSPSLLSLITSNKIRGGSENTKFMISNKILAETLSVVDTTLKSGPYGVLSLTGIASLVVVPLTLYRQGYSFSVGYGYSVLAMGYAITKTFGINISNMEPLGLLASAVMFYGARLGSYILIRGWTVPSKSLKQFDKSPRLKRIPLAVAVSMFYAFMTCPLMYAARSVSEMVGTKAIVMNVGVGLALIGALMETVTDGQKYWMKRCNTSKKDMFVGPTGGFYRLCRHPNYFAELMYWFGLFVAGAPSFGKSPIAWLCASLGMYGIYAIMTGASKRLLVKQDENYKGQEDYETYKKEVPAALWPWTS